jgi:polyisoprenoid-binding protein YceI
LNQAGRSRVPPQHIDDISIEKALLSRARFAPRLHSEKGFLEGYKMRFGRLLSLFAFALPLVVHAAASAQVRTFKVDEGADSKIQFVSDAPLERFTGTSSKVSGEIKLDPQKATAAKGEIKVKMNSIKTGIDLRDEHFQSENWLDAKKFPDSKFVITKITGVSALKPGESVEATVVGKFTLHGITKDVTSQAKVRLVPAEGGKPESLRVQATFKVKLEDHKVSIPSIVALKVAPEIQVNVDLLGKKS